MLIPAPAGAYKAVIGFMIVGTITIVIMGLVGALKVSHAKNETLGTKLLAAEQAIEGYKEVVLHLEEQSVKDRESLKAVHDQLKGINVENAELRKSITKARSKENVLEKKPSLVESRIRAASKRMFDDISEATGYRPQAPSSP